MTTKELWEQIVDGKDEYELTEYVPQIPGCNACYLYKHTPDNTWLYLGFKKSGTEKVPQVIMLASDPFIFEVTKKRR